MIADHIKHVNIPANAECQRFTILIDNTDRCSLYTNSIHQLVNFRLIVSGVRIWQENLLQFNSSVFESSILGNDAIGVSVGAGTRYTFSHITGTSKVGEVTGHRHGRQKTVFVL